MSFLEGGGWKCQFYFYGRGDFPEAYNFSDTLRIIFRILFLIFQTVPRVKLINNFSVAISFCRRAALTFCLTEMLEKRTLKHFRFFLRKPPFNQTSQHQNKGQHVCGTFCVWFVCFLVVNLEAFRAPLFWRRASPIIGDEKSARNFA